MDKAEGPPTLFDWGARPEALGGKDVLKRTDMPELAAGCGRVLALLQDGQWHDAEEIRAAAGEPGRPASEGLRRLRELRRKYQIDRRSVNGTRMFEYRLGEPKCSIA
jgi:hypothetical protein